MKGGKWLVIVITRGTATKGGSDDEFGHWGPSREDKEKGYKLFSLENIGHMIVLHGHEGKIDKEYVSGVDLALTELPGKRWKNCVILSHAAAAIGNAVCDAVQPGSFVHNPISLKEYSLGRSGHSTGADAVCGRILSSNVSCSDVTSGLLADVIKKKVYSSAVIEARLIELRRLHLAYRLENEVYEKCGGSGARASETANEFNSKKIELKNMLKLQFNKYIEGLEQLAIDNVGLTLDEILCDLPSRIKDAEPNPPIE